MKITRKRLQRIIDNKFKQQTRKKYKKHVKQFGHNNTARKRRSFNLKNNTLKYI
jgi:hypothetical protein